VFVALDALITAAPTGEPEEEQKWKEIAKLAFHGTARCVLPESNFFSFFSKFE
jgi:hypothetical protein